ncbi:MAG: hypothetical protein OEZ59_06225 [Deltaproteobacteria bacterium]|nr:hypothetical protein [Deltaproteobacteria bacterium]
MFDGFRWCNAFQRLFLPTTGNMHGPASPKSMYHILPFHLLPPGLKNPTGICQQGILRTGKGTRPFFLIMKHILLLLELQVFSHHLHEQHMFFVSVSIDVWPGVITVKRAGHPSFYPVQRPGFLPAN